MLIQSLILTAGLILSYIFSYSFNYLPKDERKFLSIIILAIMTIFWTVTSNYSQVITMKLYTIEYSFFAFQYMNILYFFPFGFIMLKFYKRKGWIGNNSLKLQAYFAFIAIFDSFGVFLIGVGNSGTPPELQSIFSQVNIPLTFFLSIILLKKKQRVLSGLIVTLLLLSIIYPFIIELSTKTVDFDMWSCIAQLIGNSVFSISFTLKEWLMCGCNISSPDLYIFGIRIRKVEEIVHPIYLTTWVAFWMIIITFPLILLQTIQGLGGISISDIPDAIYGGLICTFGNNIYNTTANCDGLYFYTWTWLQLFAFSSFVQGLCLIFITDYGSAVVEYIVSAIAIPVSLILYSSALMGPYQEPISIHIYISTVLILILTACYLLTENETREQIVLFINSIRRRRYYTILN